jgi:hypothetical protein
MLTLLLWGVPVPVPVPVPLAVPMLVPVSVPVPMSMLMLVLVLVLALVQAPRLTWVSVSKVWGLRLASEHYHLLSTMSSPETAA